jgi:hypothetical protein
VESTQPSEEIDEAEGLTTSSHHFCPVRPRPIGRDFSWFVQAVALCHFLLWAETRQGQDARPIEKPLQDGGFNRSLRSQLTLVHRTLRRQNSRMKVFVSSLIGGYEALRQAARDAIVSLGHEPIMAEDFRAQPNSPQLACLKGLRMADLVVLVLVDRYGQPQAGSGVSPTHEEYLEAKGRKPILLFVQEGVTAEPKQQELLREVQGWQGGLFREGFTSPEQLRTLITRSIHSYELAHAAGPVNGAALAREAAALISGQERGGGQGSPALRFALACGPTCQLLRPAELEAESLAEAIQQRAMFGSPRVFAKDQGVETSIKGDSLLLSQESGARIRLNGRGAIELRLPLERGMRRDRGFGSMLGVIEESVVRELANAISFSSWLLDHIDATQRATHVGIAAILDASDHLGWRTQAEQDASPNSGTMRMHSGPDMPAELDQPRASLKFDAARLAEDLMVPIRRQRKTYQ